MGRSSALTGDHKTSDPAPRKEIFICKRDPVADAPSPGDDIVSRMIRFKAVVIYSFLFIFRLRGKLFVDRSRFVSVIFCLFDAPEKFYPESGTTATASANSSCPLSAAVLYR